MALPAVQLQLPELSTVAVQIVVAPSISVTVPPGWPVPAKVGVLSLVLVPSTGLVTAGGTSDVVSMTMFSAELGEDVLPAASVAVKVSSCGPSANVLDGVKV
jgi:hypothetical protein